MITVRRLARTSLVIVCFALAFAPAAPLAGQHTSVPAHTLPDRSLYRLTGRWTSHLGRDVDLATLRGNPAVIAMVYTSCTMTCPLITREMLAVQRALPPDVASRVRFVLASFDPARDSVAALRRHAETMRLDERWLVLRAPPVESRQLAVLLGVTYRQLPNGDFDHSNIISVLDADGVLSFQSPRVPADREALVRAVIATARAGAPSPEPRRRP